MSYSGSIKMPGELYKEIQKKYEKPATGIPSQDLSFLVTAEINKKAEIDDTAGVGDTDKTYSADKLTSDHSSLLSAITQNSTEELLLRDDLPGTTTTVTMDNNGNPTSIVHSANGETVRSDVFVWVTGSVTETRTASGYYITITTNLDTLAQTISEIQEVA